MSGYWVAASALALSIALLDAPAAAQSAPTPDGQDASAQEAPAQEAGETVADIVVTAQKRSENMQKVPIAVSALDADTLKSSGITSTRNLNAAVPGLSLGGYAGATLPFLRGVGQLQALNGLESPVAMYIDGIYLLSPGSGAFSLGSVSRLEVLRGPQGTLFGRNATGGVVQFITRDPSTRPSLDASVGFGNFDTYEASLYGTVGLAPHFATSLAINWRDQTDGYGRNLFLGTRPYKQKAFALQSKTKWDSDDGRTSATINFIYDQGHFHPDIAVPPGLVAEDGVTRYTAPRTTYARYDADTKAHQYLASLALTHDFGGGIEATNLIGYHRTVNDAFFDQNAIPGNIVNPTTGVTRGAVLGTLDQKGETFTDELQVSANVGSWLKLQGGFFYLRDVSTLHQVIASNETFLFSLDSRIRTESYAGFLQGTASLTPTTRATLGIRYTQDRVHFSGTSTNAPFSVTGGGIDPSLKNGAPTYRVALDQDLGPDMIVYGSWNRGFRSGRYVINNFRNAPVKPEYIDSYEIGFKSKLLDNRLRFNLAAFLYNYDNIQVRATTVGGISATVNAAKARGKGVDIDFELVPFTRFTISGGAEFLDAKYLKFPGAPCPTINPAGGVNSTAVCDLSGARLPFAPSFSTTIRANYEIPTPIGSFRLSAGDAYSSGYRFEPDGRIHQGAFHDVSASVGWLSRDERLEARLWVRNLANSEIWAGGSTNSTVTYIPGDPRMYGVTLGIHLK